MKKILLLLLMLVMIGTVGAVPFLGNHSLNITQLHSLNTTKKNITHSTNISKPINITANSTILLLKNTTLIQQNNTKNNTKIMHIETKEEAQMKEYIAKGVLGIIIFFGIVLVILLLYIAFKGIGWIFGSNKSDYTKEVSNNKKELKVDDEELYKFLKEELK